MSKIIFANWKNNPSSVEEAVKLAEVEVTDNENLVIFPPSQFIVDVSKVLKKSPLGAQDFSNELINLGVKYVIIGHSDRRKAGDTNEVVAEKFSSAINADLIPILCVGETLEQKQQGLRESVVKEEIWSAFQNLKIENWKLKIFIAYEPIWAISTNPNAEPDKPENTLAMIKFIKNVFSQMPAPYLPPRRDGSGSFPRKWESNIRFIYGGSITSKNAGLFLQYPEIEGALVGKASLDSLEISKIVKVALDLSGALPR